MATNNIDDYINGYPKNIQNILKQIRHTIRMVAPNAKETIKYQMPTFTMNGNLVHFAAFKNHIGLYPTPSAIGKFKADLSKYQSTKGAVRFPLDKPIPYGLIKKIVRFRVKENLSQSK